MRRNLQRTLLATAGFAMIAVAQAAEIDVDRVAACAKERNDARRLACYDDAVAVTQRPAREQPAQSAPVAVAAPAAAAVTSPKAAQPTAPTANPESDFGIEGSAVARERSSKQEQEQAQREDVDSITAVVTEVSKQPRGELVITLDNGQTWMQKKRERYFPIEPGDSVTIHAGMLGSFRMSNGNRMTQVTRVK